MRTLVDQARFLAQSVVLEAEHGDPPEVLRRRLEQRQAIAAERFPFTSIAIVPAQGPRMPATPAARHADAAADDASARGSISTPPERLPPWIRCDGFAGLLAYEAPRRRRIETRLVMRAVALPQTRRRSGRSIVDLPFTNAIEERLREETGIRLGEVTALAVRTTRRS